MNKAKYLPKDQLLKLIQRLPGTIYEYREYPDGRCSFPYSAPGIESIFFASPKQLAKDGRLAWECTTRETAHTLRKALDRSAERMEQFEATFQTCSPQGRLHWIHTHAVPERQRDGSMLWCGHMENITAQYEAEAAAKQKTAMLNFIFETLPDQIYYMDRNSRLIDINPACCSHHGMSRDQMIGKSDMDLYPGEFGERLLREEQVLMAEGKTLREREEHVLDDGRTIYLESVKCPLRNEAGEIIGLAGISRDISQQVEDEKKLLQAKTEAEQTAALIEAIFKTVPDRLYFKDAQARALGGNPAWVSSHGFKRVEEMIGKTDVDLHPAPMGRELYEKELQQLKTGETTRVREKHTDAQGRTVYIEAIKAPFRDSEGNIAGLVGISRDITLQVENERKLMAAQQEAEAANKAKSAFLAMMSHEIRTPMNGVIGAASLLMGTELNDQQEEFVHTIQVSGENLMTIINDILDYSKIEAGKIELECVPFSPRECIEDAFDLFVQAAAKKNIELLYYVEPEVPSTLKGDPTRLRQILVNLLGNAVKFTEQGEVDLQAQLLTHDTNHNRCTLQFSVRDTGIGISEEARKKLFQSFTQADASSTRKYGGTGLGLAISRRLTDLMGGDIWIESTEGEGTTFHFTVELEGAPPQPARIERSPDGRRLQDRRVLIVDDNETNRHILCAQMEQWGARPTAFARPELVVPHLRETAPYDIMILDYQMPGMDGEMLAKAIYKLSDYPRTPIIILSSSHEDIAPHPAISARMTKPAKVEKLREQMLRLLFRIQETEQDSGSAEQRIRNRKVSSMRILIAEDNPINQRVVLMMLKRLGYENTVLVEDGQQAVAAVLDASYDVILMDVQMPNMNGLDATAIIREHSRSEVRPYIIALTAGVMDEERRQIFDVGMNDILAKPLVVDQLDEKLSALEDCVEAGGDAVFQ